VAAPIMELVTGVANCPVTAATSVANYTPHLLVRTRGPPIRKLCN